MSLFDDETPPTVCLAHMRFVPCRRDGDHEISTDPVDVARVNAYHQETPVTEIPTESWSRFIKRHLPRVPSWLPSVSPIRVSFQRGPEVRIYLNSNVKMTRGKAAAQAVHAALQAFDVPHGRVVVLGGSPAEIAQMQVQIRDAGRTEIEPGTLTAGCTLYPGDDPGDNGAS